MICSILLLVACTSWHVIWRSRSRDVEALQSTEGVPVTSSHVISIEGHVTVKLITWPLSWSRDLTSLHRTVAAVFCPYRYACYWSDHHKQLECIALLYIYRVTIHLLYIYTHCTLLQSYPLVRGCRGTRKYAQKPRTRGVRVREGCPNICWTTDINSKICQNNGLLYYIIVK